jgi:acetoacetyl-CoA synthetase
MSELLWSPSPARIAAEPITAFMEAAETVGGPAAGAGYAALHRWSVEAPEAFWSLLWDFAGVRASERGTVILEDGERFPGARWFPGAQLNYAENLLRRDDDRTAVIGLLEDGRRRTLTHGELFNEVSRLAAALRDAGVQAGDRVAGFMPNLPETLVAMLATASIGAVWSSCSPDFGVNGVLDRFGQIAPKVLFAADGYLYNGKRCDSLERLRAVSEAIDSIETIVVVPLLAAQPALDGLRGAHRYGDFLVDGTPPLAFAQLPFDHPLFIMYSSGTTGVPKCIVHGAGGTLLQHLKEHRLQVGLRPGDVFFYFTTCGWMMWNWLVSGLASGATLLLYDGSPFAAEGNLLLDAIDGEGINVFGTSAKFIAALEKGGKQPARSHDLDSLRTILSTGSPLSHESFEYVYRDFKADVCLSSISGGTDILSCFVGGCPCCRSLRRDPGCGPRYGRGDLERRRRPGAWRKGRAGLYAAVPRPARSVSGTTRTARAFAPPTSTAGPASGPMATTANHGARRLRHPRPLRRGAQSRRRAHRHGGNLPPGRTDPRGAREHRHRPALGRRRARGAVRGAARGLRTRRGPVRANPPHDP